MPGHGRKILRFAQNDREESEALCQSEEQRDVYKRQVLTRFVKGTKKLHPVVFILFSALAGVVFSF